jgi:hypothetical protein
MMSTGNDITETVQAQGNLQDVTELIANMRKNREPLLHCAVFIELKAASLGALKELQSETAMELTRSKITVDRLTLRQKEGFLSVLPTGCDRFGTQYERVLPASSVADLYPFNYSGKTDPHGLYIGRDKYGTNILVDFDRRAQDKTTSNILILGNSGQGKSYLLKLILDEPARIRQKRDQCWTPRTSTRNSLRRWADAISTSCPASTSINPLNRKRGADGSDEDIDATTPEAFRKVTRLSQHIAYSRIFSAATRISRTRRSTRLRSCCPSCTPVSGSRTRPITARKAHGIPDHGGLLQAVRGRIHTATTSSASTSIRRTPCRTCASESIPCASGPSKYFNGHTNITDSHFLCFGVKGLDGHKSKAQGRHAVQYPVVHEQSAARQGRHSGGYR